MPKKHIVKPLRQNSEPLASRELPFDNRTDWERDIFDRAVYFTVTRKTGPGRLETQQFATLLEAFRSVVYRAGGKLFRDLNAMVYAVAEDKSAFCIPYREWMFYTKRWEEKHGIQETR